RRMTSPWGRAESTVNDALLGKTTLSADVNSQQPITSSSRRAGGAILRPFRFCYSSPLAPRSKLRSLAFTRGGTHAESRRHRRSPRDRGRSGRYARANRGRPAQRREEHGERDHVRHGLRLENVQPPP